MDKEFAELDKMMGVDSPEYRAAVDACKERILINLEIIRKESPHLFQ
jgi:hypothetical protein